MFLSDRDFHPTVGAYFQAHPSGPSGAINRPKSSKYPAHSPEKAASWSKLRSKNTDSGTVSQFVALIEEICDVEPELEPAIFFREAKGVSESQIDWIIPRQLIRVRKAAFRLLPCVLAFLSA